MINYSIKNNLMYLIKILKRCWFWCYVNDIPIVIWAQNWTVSTICDRLILCLFFVYRKSTVGQSLIYMQHMHMECGKPHIWHDLVLDQNVSDNSYSNPLHHEALDVYHKIVIIGIGSYYNTFSHLCVQHQYYPEHSILCLSILFYWLFSIFYLINDSVFLMLFIKIFL